MFLNKGLVWRIAVEQNTGNFKVCEILKGTLLKHSCVIKLQENTQTHLNNPNNLLGYGSKDNTVVGISGGTSHHKEHECSIHIHKEQWRTVLEVLRTVSTSHFTAA